MPSGTERFQLSSCDFFHFFQFFIQKQSGSIPSYFGFGAVYMMDVQKNRISVPTSPIHISPLKKSQISRFSSTFFFFFASPEAMSVFSSNELVRLPPYRSAFPQLQTAVGIPPEIPLVKDICIVFSAASSFISPDARNGLPHSGWPHPGCFSFTFSTVSKMHFRCSSYLKESSSLRCEQRRNLLYCFFIVDIPISGSGRIDMSLPVPGKYLAETTLMVQRFHKNIPVQ